MKKIKLTKDEKKACRDVIAFWKKVEKRLEAGEKAYRGAWVKSGLAITFYPTCNCGECPLCAIAGDTRGASLESICFHCVYYKAYGLRCFNLKGHLSKFEKNSNLRTCRSAIRSVQRILANSKAR